MRLVDLFEDSWSGPGNAWHNSDDDNQWSNGNDEWHGQASGNMIEDFAVANIVATETENKGSFSDVVTAMGLIQAATSDPKNEKYKYFEFLKKLRNKHGADYSTDIHQRACKLIKSKA